jgi:hypothetical protein
METNQFQKLPDDYVRYPGKMDHATMVAFRARGLAAERRVRSSLAVTFSLREESLPVSPFSVRLGEQPVTSAKTVHAIIGAYGDAVCG